MQEQQLHRAQPSHPGLIEVKQGTGFSSYAISLQDLDAGSLLTKLDSATPVEAPAYSTVQAGKHAHVELNSDLLYTNHSCDPSLVFDMEKLEVRVIDDRPLRRGDILTFFYPSTEWEMAQEFDCQCGSRRCLGKITGAKQMRQEELRRYWLNAHIEEMLAEEESKEKGVPLVSI